MKRLPNIFKGESLGFDEMGGWLSSRHENAMGRDDKCLYCSAEGKYLILNNGHSCRMDAYIRGYEKSKSLRVEAVATDIGVVRSGEVEIKFCPMCGREL